MTNSSASSQKKKNKLLLIHGLNNSRGAFTPLADHFRSLGLETVLLTLPCHGDNRDEARDFKEAFACFDRSILKHAQEPFSVIAFSQGALYLQLWLEKRPDLRPLRQVLLAPALHIRRHKFIEKLMFFLPGGMPIPSLSPRSTKRYGYLRVSEYRILLEGIANWQRPGARLKVPTLVLVDPQDELVDPEALERELKGGTHVPLKFRLWPREEIPRTPGAHHILFHPDFFLTEDWRRFTSEIEKFLEIALEEGAD